MRNHQLRERGSEDRERGDVADRLRGRDVRRRLEEAERQQHDERTDQRRGRQHRPAHVGDEALAVERGDAVRERREQHRDDAGDAPPAATQRSARENRDAREAEHHAERADAARALVRAETHREQRREDRHGRIRDRREPGADVPLAPGDQRERDRRVEEAERVAPSGARRNALSCRCVARKPASTATASATRISIIVAGSSSSPAILMTR
jgi:hypothetical protein